MNGGATDNDELVGLEEEDGAFGLGFSDDETWKFFSVEGGTLGFAGYSV